MNNLLINTSVEITILDKNIVFYLNFSDYEKEFSKINKTNPKFLPGFKAKFPIKLYIKANLINYIKFLKSKNNSYVKISGDVNYAIELEKLLTSFNFDLEEYLNKYLGELPSYQTTKLINKFKNSGINIKNNFTYSLKEFLLYEKKLAPTKEDIDFYIREVDYLRDYVDRLEIKLNNLLKNFNLKLDFDNL